MKFKVETIIDVSPGAKGLLIPIFKMERSNLPFAQEMNDAFEVYEMKPYLAADYYEYLIPKIIVSTDVGELGVFAFRSFDDEVFVGNVSDVMQYRDVHREKFLNFPLLDLQLARVCGEPMGTLHTKWKRTEEAYFGERRNGEWVRNELSVYQKNKTIWDSINATQEEDSRERIVAEINQHSFEYLFRWLSKNLANPAWNKVWLHTFKLNPFDERMQMVAEDWLRDQMSENLFFDDIKLVLFCHLEYRFQEKKETDDFKEFFSDYMSYAHVESFQMLSPLELPVLILRNIDLENSFDVFFQFYTSIINRISGDSRYKRTEEAIKQFVQDHVSGINFTDSGESGTFPG